MSYLFNCKTAGARRKTLISAAASLALAWLPAVAATNDPPAAGNTEDPGARLAAVRAELSRALRESSLATKNYFNIEHDIVYTNAALNKFYLSVKDLEKTLLQKKKELQEEMMKAPEIRQAMKERADAFDKVSKLQDRERVLLKEANRGKAPVPSTDGK